jgi:hypothetical protein
MKILQISMKALRLPLHWGITILNGSASALSVAFEWLRLLRVELWLVEGEEKNSRAPLSLLCGVRGREKTYLLRLMFADGYRQHCIGRFWLWNLPKVIRCKGADCSMAVLEVSDSQRRFLRGDDYFFLPMWVQGDVDLPRDKVALRRVKEDLRRIRRHALDFEVTTDPRKFDDFYHHMYLPSVTKSFGDCAFVTLYRHEKHFFRAGELLLVNNQEGSIAGIVLQYTEKGPILRDSGIRDGNRAYVQRSASSALYHFGFQHLESKEHKGAWLGWSRPWLNDGVLRFKRKWGQRISDSYSWGSEFALRILTPTAATTAFLCSNPFIFRRDGLLYGAVFVPADMPLTPENIRRIDKDLFHPGMTRLFVYHPEESGEHSSDLVPADCAERVELHNAMMPSSSRSRRAEGQEEFKPSSSMSQRDSPT